MATAELALPVPPLSAVVPRRSMIVIDERTSFSVPESAFSLEGFREWATGDEFPERGRICFLECELQIDMSAELYDTHNQVKGEISSALWTINRREKLGRVFYDRMLLTNKSAGISTEPDAMFASRATMQSGKLRQVPRGDLPQGCKEMEGTPDWVLEVVSPSSIRKDKKQLREKYWLAGIGEYWLVDALGEHLEFNILVRGDAGYVESPVLDGWQQSLIFSRSFKLDRERDDLGDWVYTLSVKDL